MKAMLTTLICAAGALPLAAQAGGDTTTRQKPASGTAQADKPAFVSVDHLLGSKVYVTGTGGATPLDEATKLSVKDLVVESRSGEVFGALLEHDDRAAAVPLSMIHVTRPKDDPDGDPVFELQMDVARLKSLPSFDLEAAKEKGFDSAVVVLESSWSVIGLPSAREAGAPKAKEITPGEPAVIVTGTEFMSLPVRFVLASKLDGIDVFSRTEDFGDVEDILVDTSNKKLAYVVVAHGGVLGVGDEKYLIPFRALSIGNPKGDKDKRVLVIDMPADALAVEAAQYKKPDKGFITKERAEQYDKFFEPAIKSKTSREDKPAGGG